jgi:hypothetical protein
MIFLGLFVVVATSLRLEQRACGDGPRDAAMSCDIRQDSCDVTREDLEIKRDYILSSKKITQRVENVVRQFDECLTRFVENPQNVKELRRVDKYTYKTILDPHEMYFPALEGEMVRPYLKVKDIDKKLHQKLQDLSGQTYLIDFIKGTLRKNNIRHWQDCLANEDNLKQCKAIQQGELPWLISTHGKYETLRNLQVRSTSQALQQIMTETKTGLQDVKNFIAHTTQMLVDLQFYEPTLTCGKNDDCYRLSLAGSNWRNPNSHGLIHGLWYQKYDPEWTSGIDHGKVSENFVPARWHGHQKWAISDSGVSVMAHEWNDHGRFQPGMTMQRYFDTAASLFDQIQYLRHQDCTSTICKTMARLSRQTKDMVYCFKRKAGVAGVGMALVKCY